MENPLKNNQEAVARHERLFADAISTTRIVEIPTRFDAESEQHFREHLLKANLFLLGEMHGVTENAEVIYSLFKRFGFRELALEWEPELAEVAQKYISGGVIDFRAIKDSPDGRITAGHFVLLKKLSEEGLLDNLLCFDGGSSDRTWNGRDAAMARNIFAGHKGTPMLVVAGNYHARTEEFTPEDEAEAYVPMGKHLNDKTPEMPKGNIEYLSGSYYNYGHKEFSAEEGKGEAATFYEESDGRFVYQIPHAHAATVPDPDKRL